MLELDDGVCLVDCGTSLEPGWDALVRGLELAGARPEDVRTLVCTHMHADHAGLASTLIERTGCELLRGVGPHTIDDRLRDPGTALAERRAIGRREGVPEAEIDRWVDAHLADDVRHTRAARATGCSRRATSSCAAGSSCPTPGHSPNQIALVDEQRRWAITADLAYDVAEPFVEWGWTLDPYGEHLASLDRVAELAPRMLLPGHGRPVEDGPERLAAARAAAEALATNALAALADGPRSAYDLAVGGGRRPGGEQPPPVDAVDLALRARAPRAARGRDVRDRRRRRAALQRSLT